MPALIALSVQTTDLSCEKEFAMSVIDAAQWKGFADRFSRDHDGWSASLELRETDGGMDVAIDDRPFRGLTFEHHDSHDSLILTFGDDADEHISHIIANPHDLTVLDPSGNECSLIIGLEDGSGCVLELTNPLIPD